MVIAERSDLLPGVVIDTDLTELDGELKEHHKPTSSNNARKEGAADLAEANAVACNDSSAVLHEQTTNDEKVVVISDAAIASSAQDLPETIMATDDQRKDTDALSTQKIDSHLIAQAEDHLHHERLLEAARALRRVEDISLFREKHWKALQKAERVEATVKDLTSSPDDGWTKQGETHGQYDTIIFYKVDKDTRLTARLETPIDASLLVPLLSVFNESELYKSWMPHMNGLGISESIKLRQSGRGNQIISVTSYLPWPLADREAIIEATAVDDIGTNNHIVVRMETRYKGQVEDGLIIPPPKSGVVRVDFDGGILFRKCPDDHVAFSKSKVHHRHANHDSDDDNGSGGSDPMILVCFTMHIDAHVQYVPQKLINFVTRTVLGRMWSSLLQVAQDIRDGKRPQQAQAIADKRDLYEWVEQRVKVMIESMDETRLATAAMGAATK